MDPKTANVPHPVSTDNLDCDAEVWEPPFERWLRLTEILVPLKPDLGDYNAWRPPQKI